MQHHSLGLNHFGQSNGPSPYQLNNVFTMMGAPAQQPQMGYPGVTMQPTYFNTTPPVSSFANFAVPQSSHDPMLGSVLQPQIPAVQPTWNYTSTNTNNPTSNVAAPLMPETTPLMPVSAQPPAKPPERIDWSKDASKVRALFSSLDSESKEAVSSSEKSSIEAPAAALQQAPAPASTSTNELSLPTGGSTSNPILSSQPLGFPLAPNMVPSATNTFVGAQAPNIQSLSQQPLNADPRLGLGLTQQESQLATNPQPPNPSLPVGMPFPYGPQTMPTIPMPTIDLSMAFVATPPGSQAPMPASGSQKSEEDLTSTNTSTASANFEDTTDWSGFASASQPSTGVAPSSDVSNLRSLFSSEPVADAPLPNLLGLSSGSQHQTPTSTTRSDNNPIDQSSLTSSTGSHPPIDTPMAVPGTIDVSALAAAAVASMVASGTLPFTQSVTSTPSPSLSTIDAQSSIASVPLTSTTPAENTLPLTLESDKLPKYGQKLTMEMMLEEFERTHSTARSSPTQSELGTNSSVSVDPMAQSPQQLDQPALLPDTQVSTGTQGLSSSAVPAVKPGATPNYDSLRMLFGAIDKSNAPTTTTLLTTPSGSEAQPPLPTIPSSTDNEDDEFGSFESAKESVETEPVDFTPVGDVPAPAQPSVVDMNVEMPAQSLQLPVVKPALDASFPVTTPKLTPTEQLSAPSQQTTPPLTKSSTSTTPVNAPPCKPVKQDVQRWQLILGKCADELEAGATYFNNVKEILSPNMAEMPEICNKFFGKAEVRSYIRALVRVYKIVENIQEAFLSNPVALSSYAASNLPSISVLLSKTTSVWSQLRQAVQSLDSSQVESNDSAMLNRRCGLCHGVVYLNESRIMWGDHTCHLPCANFWLNRVNPNPPF